MSVSQGCGAWWRRQPCGGGRCTVPSGADAAGGERLQGQGWGNGQVTAKPGVPPASSSSVTSTVPRWKSEARGGGGGLGEWGRGPRLLPVQVPPALQGLPKPCLAHLTEGRAAEGCCLDEIAIFVDGDEVLAEEPAPRHVDNGHTVLEQKPQHQATGWGLVPRPATRALRGWRLTQVESAKDTSGKLRVKYSFLVHTATTRVPVAVKKASKPEPLLVKKLGAGQASYACWLSCSPWQSLVPGSHPPV